MKDLALGKATNLIELLNIEVHSISIPARSIKK